MESPDVVYPYLGNVDENAMEDMSPMTNLARNMSSLSTSLSLTPCRRISWSNPHSNGPKSYLSSVSNSPFVADSPSFQEGVLRGLENRRNKKSDKFRPPQKILDRSIVNKENVESDSIENICKPLKSNFALNLDEISESDLSGSSQESGYYEPVYDASNFTQSIRSSIFTDEEIDDDDESFFPIDKNDDDMSSSMSELIKNPLKDSANGNFKSSIFSKAEVSRKVKPAIRRCLSMSVPSYNCDESPSSSATLIVEFSSNEVNKENDECESIKSAFKRPEPIDESTPLQAKRRKSSPTVKISPANKQILQRCYSETEATIMKAVQKSDQHPDFIGDFTRPFLLPLISGRHQDLKTITSETLVRLLNREFKTVNHFNVIDCRYPYEYNGGHIRGARNIFTKEDIFNSFLSGVTLKNENENSHKNLMIFHCEFSSERAPKLLRFLRNKDREINETSYPRLFHPEIYLLEGGYKAFFEDFKDYCEPQSYKPMVHKDHTRELCEFRAKSKSFGNESKLRPKLRSNLKF